MYYITKKHSFVHRIDNDNVNNQKLSLHKMNIKFVNLILSYRCYSCPCFEKEKKCNSFTYIQILLINKENIHTQNKTNKKQTKDN